jgi:hypothetical protein
MKVYQSQDLSKPIREIITTDDDPSASMLVRYENELELIANNEVKSFLDHMLEIGMIDEALANIVRMDHPRLFS